MERIARLSSKADRELGEAPPSAATAGGMLGPPDGAAPFARPAVVRRRCGGLFEGSVHMQSMMSVVMPDANFRDVRGDGEAPSSAPSTAPPSARGERGAADAAVVEALSFAHGRRRSSDAFVALSVEMEELQEQDESLMGVDPLHDLRICGSFSCHGRDVAREGGRVDKINQDCACVVNTLGGRPGTAMLCVLDGHGAKGHDVSLEALFALHSEVDRRIASLGDVGELPEHAGTFLIESFESVNEHLRRLAAVPATLVDASESGACACAALLRGRHLWVANAGDCRAVLGTRRGAEGARLAAVALSTDHKADLPAEQARIEAAGGYVKPAVGEPDAADYTPARVFEDGARLLKGPGLAVSRSLGDLTAADSGVIIPSPEVVTYEVDVSDDCFVILASDGVWEFISMEEACEIVDEFYAHGRRAIDACRLLIAKAALAWREHEGVYRDDITAIVIYLPELLGALADESVRRGCVWTEGEAASAAKAAS